MFYITKELGVLIGRNGFHFYPWSDRASVGIGFRFVWNKTVRCFRWSAIRKRFFYTYVKVSDEDIRKNKEIFGEK